MKGARGILTNPTQPQRVGVGGGFGLVLSQENNSGKFRIFQIIMSPITIS